jgi:hypothetical protein
MSRGYLGSCSSKEPYMYVGCSGTRAARVCGPYAWQFIAGSVARNEHGGSSIARRGSYLLSDTGAAHLDGDSQASLALRAYLSLVRSPLSVFCGGCCAIAVQPEDADTIEICVLKEKTNVW